MPGKNGLLERLEAGQRILVGEGYIFELESRGYLKAGGFVPIVVLEHPELVKSLHQEMVHAGSDVVVATTFNGHREKMRLIGREDDIEKINRQALRLARKVADETGTLMAGDLCHTTLFKPDDPEIAKTIYGMFEEQVKWAVEEGADYIIAEMFYNLEEARLALKAIKEFGNGLPAVVTLTVPKGGVADCNLTVGEACKVLEDDGAAVVGLNCARGPTTMLPLLKDIRATCKGPIAALPVPYRTSDSCPTFQCFDHPDYPDRSAFPDNLNCWLSSHDSIAKFTKEASELGVQYMGICCGNRANYMRTMAEALGRKPAASRFSPDMSMHYSRRTDQKFAHTMGHFKSVYKCK